MITSKKETVKKSFGRIQSEKKGADFLASLSPEEFAQKNYEMACIMQHPLFTSPPKNVEDSHAFGWMRGAALLLETFMYGRWNAWLTIIDKGSYQEGDMPENPIETASAKGSDAHKMLLKCIAKVHSKGRTYKDFIEWIGYGLGISLFDKPNISDALWKDLYEEFSLDLILYEKTDILSQFVAEQGSSGHLDYFPTPIHVTKLISDMLDMKPNDSQLEPCMGAAAMLLPSKSLNLVGIDLNPFMVKVASIQAFMFLPSLLYTPAPILGLHINNDTHQIDRYFEFNTNTRIYCGDSLLGELQAPVNIFEEESEFQDIYLSPYDLSKREVFQYEEEQTKPWNSLSTEMRTKIVKAYAREIGFQIGATNPPFNMKLGKSTREQMNELMKSNKKFLQEREERLAALSIASQELQSQILYETKLKTEEYKSKGVLENQMALLFD